MRSLRPNRPLRRLGLVLVAAALVIILVATLPRAFANTDSFPVPSQATLAGLSEPQRIVALAESQVGYSTDPSNSYCNTFSAYWNAGTGGCPGGEKSEEWCADFAAWVWKQAGVTVDYQLAPGYLNGNSASFYVWGADHGVWHPVSSGYVSPTAAAPSS